MRFGANAKRETTANILKFDGLYSLAEANGDVSENRSMTNVYYEWLFKDTPWSLFTSGQIETDEFKPFDVRLSGHGGVAYKFLKTDVALLKGRAGVGGSQEIGGTDDAFQPELDFGFDAERKISDRQKFCLTFDYFPNFTHFGDYRIQAKAAYEILVDPAWNLTLKLGLLDRYDSTPEGAKCNDLEYFAVLLWKF